MSCQSYSTFDQHQRSTLTLVTHNPANNVSYFITYQERAGCQRGDSANRDWSHIPLGRQLEHRVEQIKEKMSAGQVSIIKYLDAIGHLISLVAKINSYSNINCNTWTYICIYTCYFKIKNVDILGVDISGVDILGSWHFESWYFKSWHSGS